MLAIDKRGRVLHGEEIDWTKYHLVRRVPLPPSTYFTAVNQGGATFTRNANESVTLLAPASATANLRIWVRTAPATPWTLTVLLAPTLPGAGLQHGGILFRESSSGKLHSLSPRQDGNFDITRYTNETTALSNDLDKALATQNKGACWLRIADNGTDRLFSISNDDGWTWWQAFSLTRTTHLTADQFGIFVDDEISTAAYATFHSLELT